MGNFRAETQRLTTGAPAAENEVFSKPKGRKNEKIGDATDRNLYSL
jgi:hypothetical protein